MSRAHQFGIVFAAVLVLATTAKADPTQPPPTSAPASTTAVALGAYQRWLAEVMRVSQPIQIEVANAGNGFQDAMRSSDPARSATTLRATTLRLIAAVDATETQLNAMNVPAFPELNLPAELRPAAIMAAVHRMNRDIRTGFQNYLPVFDALGRRDFATATARAGQSFGGMQQILRSQLLFARAQQAAIPREAGVWNALNVHIIYMRAAVRLSESMPSANGSAPHLPRDLRALADELDVTASEGETRMDTEQVRIRAASAEAESRGNGDLAALLTRQHQLLGGSRAYFPVARDLAILLRRQASTLGEAPGPPAIVRGLGELYPVRDRIQAINHALGAVMSQ